ncbi:protein Opi10p [[Candida] anglica]
MFGAVCSGRPIQLATQVEPTKYVITIPNAAHVSHIAVFLLPQTEFTDPNYTGLVYIQMPGSSEFILSGGLNPLKPSGIFKLSQGKITTGQGQDQVIDDVDMNIDESVATGGDVEATINIGISIEPTQQAEILLQEEKAKKMGNSNQMVPTSAKPAVAPTTTKVTPSDTAVLANRIVTHAYNYLGSFLDDSGKVPMKAFDSWWDKFKTKLQNNPSFLNEM